MVLFHTRCGITEPTFFHAGCGILPMEGTNPLTMSLPLHMTMEGTNPLTMSEWHCTYIRPAHRNGQHSHLTWKELNPLALIEWFSPYI